MPSETQPLKEAASGGAGAGARQSRCSQLYFQSRGYLWRVLGGHREGEAQLPLSFAVEWFIMVLIILNVVLVLVATGLEGENSHFEQAYRWFELASAVVFGLEYGVGMWTAVEEPRFAAPCRGRLWWAVQPLNVLDLVCLVPFVIDLALPSGDTTYRGATVLRFLRLLRLFALLRLERSTGSFARIHAVLRHKGSELLLTVFVAAIILVVSSTLMFYAEHDVNPMYDSIFIAMWWAVTALTTVGYGDVYPVTPAGRLVGAVTALVGVGFFALPAGIIGSGFIEVSMEESQSRRLGRGGGGAASGRSESSGSLIRPAHSEGGPAGYSAMGTGPGGGTSHSAADELLVLQQAAAALRRQVCSPTPTPTRTPTPTSPNPSPLTLTLTLTRSSALTLS